MCCYFNLSLFYLLDYHDIRFFRAVKTAPNTRWPREPGFHGVWSHAKWTGGVARRAVTHIKPCIIYHQLPGGRHDGTIHRCRRTIVSGGIHLISLLLLIVLRWLMRLGIERVILQDNTHESKVPLFGTSLYLTTRDDRGFVLWPSKSNFPYSEGSALYVLIDVCSSAPQIVGGSWSVGWSRDGLLSQARAESNGSNDALDANFDI